MFSKGLSMLSFDAARVQANIQRADTTDLLDRVTVYRHDLEELAYPLIVQELRERGITASDIIAHEQRRANVLIHPAGHTQRCSQCRQPAILAQRGWFKIFGLLPIFPRLLFFCEQHAPKATPAEITSNDSE
jgi:hypothetical protein